MNKKQNKTKQKVEASWKCAVKKLWLDSIPWYLWPPLSLQSSQSHPTHGFQLFFSFKWQNWKKKKKGKYIFFHSWWLTLFADATAKILSPPQNNNNLKKKMSCNGLKYFNVNKHYKCNNYGSYSFSNTSTPRKKKRKTPLNLPHCCLSSGQELYYIIQYNII